LSEDFEELIQIQSQLEHALLERTGAFLKEHPVKNSAQFTMNTFLSLAGRVGLTYLSAEHTALCMEATAETVRRHGIPKSEAH